MIEAAPGVDFHGGSGMFRSEPARGLLWAPKLGWSAGGHKYVRVPLWMPVVALALPTGLLWWRDRRYPKGHCQTCGYDLTGNTSGVCPECGAQIVRPVSESSGYRYCPRCGYSCRGAATDRCPECGVNVDYAGDRRRLERLVRRPLRCALLLSFGRSDRLTGWWWVFDQQGDGRSAVRVWLRSLLVAFTVAVPAFALGQVVVVTVSGHTYTRPVGSTPDDPIQEGRSWMTYRWIGGYGSDHGVAPFVKEVARLPEAELETYSDPLERRLELTVSGHAASCGAGMLAALLLSWGAPALVLVLHSRTRTSEEGRSIRAGTAHAGCLLVVGAIGLLVAVLLNLVLLWLMATTDGGYGWTAGRCVRMLPFLLIALAWASALRADTSRRLVPCPLITQILFMGIALGLPYGFLVCFRHWFGIYVV